MPLQPSLLLLPLCSLPSQHRQSTRQTSSSGSSKQPSVFQFQLCINQPFIINHGRRSRNLTPIFPPLSSGGEGFLVLGKILVPRRFPFWNYNTHHQGKYHSCQYSKMQPPPRKVSSGYFIFFLLAPHPFHPSPDNVVQVTLTDKITMKSRQRQPWMLRFKEQTKRRFFFLSRRAALTGLKIAGGGVEDGDFFASQHQLASFATNLVTLICICPTVTSRAVKRHIALAATRQVC